MGFTTKEEILKKWETTESRAEAKETAAIRKDIATARGYIEDALARYRKAKLKAKSKKKATEDPFAELADYRTRQSIQDDYGWGFITEARMDYLNDLWDAREKSKKKGGDAVYRDRVTDMLERAVAIIGNEYEDALFEYDQKRRKMEREAETVARENNERTWQREHGMEV